MKKYRLIKNAITSVLMASTICVSSFAPIHANANEVADNVQTASLYIPNYVPFRSHYSSYLSTFSCGKGEVIKKVWENLFYEELNWNSSHPSFYDSSYDKWSDKYYDDYNGLGGTKPNSKGMQITFSEGDFEAYFGNTLEHNPEFLGEMLGLDGFNKPSETDEEINSLMKYVMCQYLSEPSKYPALALAIVNLTAGGRYIGKSKDDAGNLLRSGTYEGTTLDFFVLTAIASYYEGDNSETYLSQNQLDWLKSYQKDLFNEYVTKSTTKNDGKSLAAKYPSIYELIARSSYAANSKSSIHPTSEFFNYIVESDTGEGAWLNLMDSVDIPGLNSYDDIGAIFEFAKGYCHGHQYKKDESCLDSKNCSGTDDGGKATEVDELAYLMHCNKDVVNLIKQNDSLAKAYSNPSSMDGAWLEKYTYRHPGKGKDAPVPFYNVSCKIVTGGNSDSGNQGAYDTSYTWIHVSAQTYATATITLAKVDEVLEDTPLSKATAVTLNWGGGNNISMYQWEAYINGKRDTEGKVKRSGNTFNIEKLNWEERQSCVIYAHLHASSSYDPNPFDSGDGKPHRRQGCVMARLSTSQNATLSVRRSDCFINGHKWEGRPEWSDDYSSVVIKYNCGNDVKHTIEVTVPTECEDMGDYYLYTASSKYTLKEDGKYDSYSVRVYKTAKTSSETIALTKDNTEGALSNRAVSDYIVYPIGSKSKETYKCASTSISFGVKNGLIGVGAKSINLNMYASRDLTNVSIIVYSKTGEPLSWNDHNNEPFKCYLYGIPDSKLRNAYIQISASCKTQNWTENYSWKKGVTPATAIAQLGASSITVSY